MLELDSKIAAKYMLALAQSKGKVLNATQLQKILFIGYGYKLANDSNNPLFSESPRAWPFGPVFPNVHKNVDAYESYSLDSDELSEIKKDKEITDLFTNLINKYSIYTATKLSDWSHSKNSPWELTKRQAGFEWNMVIPDVLIKDYFKQFENVV